MSFEGRINLQGSRATFIETLTKEAHEEAIKSFDIAALQSKLDMIEHYWNKFEEMHEKLINSKDATILEHSYVTEKVYDTCLRCYSKGKTKLIDLIRSKDDHAEIFSESFRRPAQQGPTQPQRSLPKISLPTFSGAYSEWTSFKDLFNSMVKGNTSISAVEKMHYLKTSLSGDAAHIISNLPISEDNFLTAWDLLQTRYENERILITSQLERLLSKTKIEVRSSKELNNLLNTTTECIEALKALGCPVDGWDKIIVHTMTQRLDSVTREAWEIEIGSTNVFPKFSELQKFITARARALESIEMNSSNAENPRRFTSSSNWSSQGYNSRSQPRAVTFATSSTGSAQSSGRSSSFYPCSYCDQNHFLVSCSKFRDLTPEARKEIVTQNNLCFNCFGKHKGINCQSKKSCFTCGDKHHTMIHEAYHHKVSQPQSSMNPFASQFVLAQSQELQGETTSAPRQEVDSEKTSKS